MAKVTVRTEFIYAILAVVLIVLAIPLMPTKWVINPQSLTVAGDRAILDRTVLFPVTGHAKLEWEQISPPPPMGAPECNVEAVVPYEKRHGVPFTWVHGCDLSSPPGAQWRVRYCVEAELIFGIKMRPTCITTTFYPDAAGAIQQNRSLVEDVKNLTRQIEEIQKASPQLPPPQEGITDDYQSGND